MEARGAERPTNHVHAVVGGPCEPERMLRDFKSWGTRALREKRLIENRGGIWTRHGSKRYLWTDDQIARAVRYVVESQDDPRRFVPGSEQRA